MRERVTRVMADHSARIAEIRKILQSGVTTVTTDGTTVTYDHASLRRELRALMADDDEEGDRRPFVSSIDLSKF